MTTPDHDDDHDSLPATWTQGARDAYQTVLDEPPNMTAAEVAQLWHACALESAAERHDEVALAAGMVARGSTGQPIPHPSSVEARLARSAAAAILAKLQPAAYGTPSERARRAARARSSA